MSKLMSYRKSEGQTNLNEEQRIMNKLEFKNETKEKELNESQSTMTSVQTTKSSFYGGGGGTGFFAKTPKIDVSKEPLGIYYEERKKIIFGKNNFLNEQYHISQFLLKSQKSVNNEYQKMNNTRSSFFSDVPKTAYSFALNLKENIANFCLIIKLYLLYDNKEKAFEIYLLMCKQNKKIIEYIYSKLYKYCDKTSPAMLRFTPAISLIFLQILSCLIKLSGIFCKTTFQNDFIITYLKTIYILNIIREIHKIDVSTFKNEMKYQRVYLYANTLFDCAIFSFYKYQPLKYSTYILQHILELYNERNPKDYSKLEYILLLKTYYNLGLFFYVDGKNNLAISNLTQAKKILVDIPFFPLKNEERGYAIDIGRNSAILKNQEKHLLNRLTFLHEKINNLDEKAIDNMIIKKFSKNSYNKNIALKVIKEEGNKELPRRQSILSLRNSSKLFLGIKKIILKQPLLFDHIKKKISIEIELLLSQIEFNKKNYRGALEHINMIINRNRSKDDLDSESIGKKETFNIINKTFKNLKSFQGFKVKKLSGCVNNDSSTNTNDNNYNNEESILTENEIKLIILLLEKIDHDYNEKMHVQHSNSFILNKKNNSPSSSSNNLKKINYTNFKEMEKFFIFICGLSFYQLKILNESQPKLSSKRNDLPIIFSNQFQDCLTNSQRLTLTQLETMNLTRYIILIDSEKDISPENLDYKYMKYKIKTSNDEENFKNIFEDKGRTLNSRRSIDSFGNTLSTNLYYTLNAKGKIKKEITYHDESCIFDILLNKIKNENNKEFIESHKKCILHILNTLSSDDKKLLQKSPNLLKKLLKKIEIKIKRNKNIIYRDCNEDNSYSDKINISILASQ